MVVVLVVGGGIWFITIVSESFEIYIYLAGLLVQHRGTIVPVGLYLVICELLTSFFQDHRGRILT